MKRVFAVAVLAFSLQACSDVTAPDGWRPALAPLPQASLAAPSSPAVWTVDAGANHTCAVAYTGAAFCWGFNGNGQLGNGATGSSTVPVEVGGGLAFTQVSAGMSNTCGVTTDGAAYCWGYNGSGRNGNGQSGGNSLTPVPVAGNLRFSAVSVGIDHACGVTTDNRAYCWGTNGQGRTGNGSTTGVTLSPVAVAGNLSFTSISAGNLQTCAVAVNGAAYCWGDNTSGQLGDGTTTSSATPVAVAGNHTFTAVSAGRSHSCGVTTDAGTLCWGRGQYGQLGDGVMNDLRLTPTALQGAVSGMVLVSAGGYHTCSNTGAAAYCWGFNYYGQVGDSTWGNRAQPVAVRFAKPISLVSAGEAHSCGVAATESAVYCWGANSSGQLGNAKTFDSYLPVRAALTVPTMQVLVDIVPASADNTAFRAPGAVLEVAVLGSGDFDASAVDLSTVRFAGASLSGTRLEDPNGDGFQDLIAQFAIADLALPDGASEACVTGKTQYGVPFSGCDQITLISNRPPTANAGGPYAIIATEAVMLDASASSDPDGDPLTFGWDFGDGNSAANADAKISHVYATAGSFVAAVTVSDGRGGVSRATAIVSVLSPVEAVWTLRGMVQQGLDADPGLKNLAGPLTVSARAATVSLITGDTQGAIGELGAFINKVEAALRSGRISQATADALINYARRILAVIGG